MGRYDWEEKQRQRQGESSGSNGGWWLIGVVAVGLLGAILLIGYRDAFTGSSVASSSAAPPAARLSQPVATPLSVAQQPSEQPAAAKPASADVGVTAQTHFDRCAEMRVTCVVDGDTLWLNGVKIRVADYDAPEISKPRCPSELALGQRATERFMELLNQGPFQLTMQGNRNEDRYGRELRVVMRNGKSLGDTLIAEGLAHPWVGHKLPWCN